MHCKHVKHSFGNKNLLDSERYIARTGQLRTFSNITPVWNKEHSGTFLGKPFHTWLDCSHSSKWARRSSALSESFLYWYALRFSHSSAGLTYIRNPNLVITLPVDGTAPTCTCPIALCVCDMECFTSKHVRLILMLVIPWHLYETFPDRKVHVAHMKPTRLCSVCPR